MLPVYAGRLIENITNSEKKLILTKIDIEISKLEDF